MSDEVVQLPGTLPMNYTVDPSGSFFLDVPLHLPHSIFKPTLSLAYHSNATSPSELGYGWEFKGVSIIERVPSTFEQDDMRRAVSYSSSDRFALDGHRLIKIEDADPNDVNSSTKYRFELEHWSLIFAYGPQENPTYWEQRLPDGSIKYFGKTTDSNVRRHNSNPNPNVPSDTYTRVWAISEFIDASKNKISYTYDNQSTTTGEFYLNTVVYGGNPSIPEDKVVNRTISFFYQDRPDIITRYFAGSKVITAKRLHEIESTVTRSSLKWTHEIQYESDPSPLTQVSRIQSISLKQSSTVVNPLKFEYNDEPAGGYLPSQNIGTFMHNGSLKTTRIIALNFDGNGTTDLVVATCRPRAGHPFELFINVFQNNGGKISTTPTTGSGFTGLESSETYILLPIDLDGNGKTDLVHIFRKNSEFKITMFISNGVSGYDKKETITFTPETISGDFYPGDFEGGKGGMVYVYQKVDGSNSQLKFVQFRVAESGDKLEAMTIQSGPTGLSSDFQVVVGDLDGDGADDVFIISSSSNSWAMHYLESQDRVLKYRTDDPLMASSKKIKFAAGSKVLPFRADRDAKSGLIFLYPSSNHKLQYQLLRSTGQGLLADENPTELNAPFGSVDIVRATSYTDLNLVNVVDNNGVKTLNWFRFDGSMFLPIPSITQQPSQEKYTRVLWGDLRGIGRSDCILCLVNENTATLKVDGLYLSLSQTFQPPDRMALAKNGLKLSVAVAYSPLTDNLVYSQSSDNNKQVTSRINSLSGNQSSTTAPKESTQRMPSTQTEFISTPTFVVSVLDIFTSESDPKPHRMTYKYRNGLISPQGRGWLGFESITKTLTSLGIIWETKYYQKFPLIGQAMSFQMRKRYSVSKPVLESTWQQKDYDWTFKKINGDKNYMVYLSKATETYYEQSEKLDNKTFVAYTAQATFNYDDYGNLTSTTIPHTKKSNLILASAYSPPDPTLNSELGWVVGNKTEEKMTKETDAEMPNDPKIVLQLSHIMIERTYVSGRLGSLSQKRKITTTPGSPAATWSTTTYTYDVVGNNTKVEGPGSYSQTYAYDESFLNATTITTATGKTDTGEGTFLVETRTFNDTAISSPSTIQQPNGMTTFFEYDMLERVVKTSKGRNAATKKDWETVSFSVDENGSMVETHKIWNGALAEKKDYRYIIINYDGLKRQTSVRRSQPNDLSKYIHVDTRYDELGQVSARSKKYRTGETPNFVNYSYDPMARLLDETYYPDGPGKPGPDGKPTGAIIARSIEYTFSSAKLKVSEFFSDGPSSRRLEVTKELTVLPNTNPNARNLVKLHATKRTDATGRGITTVFDDLGRPTEIADPSNVKLRLTYDMLSREIGRSLEKADGTKFNHTSLTFEAAASQSTLKNELMNSEVVVTTDFAGRPKKKETPDEIIEFFYDDGGAFSKGQLTRVVDKGKTSGVYPNKNVEHTFAYDTQGYLKTETIKIGERSFPPTSYTYTETGQLAGVVNPNGDKISTSFYPDGMTPKEIQLKDGELAVASVEFSAFDNPFGAALDRTFGNGVTSKSTLSTRGMLTSNTTGTPPNMSVQQNWSYDSFNKIKEYTNSSSKRTYKYDLNGQLTNSTDISGDMSYDDSGNISKLRDQVITNDGWQATKSVDGGITIDFKYSKDGNMISKKIGEIGLEMSFDAEARLASFESVALGRFTTQFLYDFAGRLLQSTSFGKTVTYISQTYEVETSTLTNSTKTISYIFQRFRTAGYEKVSDSTPGKTYYFHTDHLGSTIAVSDSGKNIITQYKYDAYGKLLETSGEDIARYKYSGKELFSATLYHFGARFYDPHTGRFLTLDTFPIDFDNITPSTFNLYLFSRNNPINFIDLNGNAPVTWWHWLTDAALMAAGLLLLIVDPALIPVAGTWLSAHSTATAALSGVLVGGGLGGVVTDYQVHNSPATKESHAEWAYQIMMGGFFGGISGAASQKVGSYLTSKFGLQNIALGAAISGQTSVNKGLQFTGVFTFQTYLDGSLGGISGIFQQLLTNGYSKNNAGDGLLDAFGYGFAGGLVFSFGGALGKELRVRRAQLRRVGPAPQFIEMQSLQSSGSSSSNVSLAGANRSNAERIAPLAEEEDFLTGISRSISDVGFRE